MGRPTPAPETIFTELFIGWLTLRPFSQYHSGMHRFTTIINRENKWYVARCVELGVVSQGKTIEDAQKNLKEAVELYLFSD